MRLADGEREIMENKGENKKGRSGTQWAGTGKRARSTPRFTR